MMKHPIISIIILTVCTVCSLQAVEPTEIQKERSIEIANSLIARVNKTTEARPTSSVVCHSGLTPGRNYHIDDYDVKWSMLPEDGIMVHYRHTKGGSSILGAYEFMIFFNSANPNGACFDQVWTPKPKHAEQGSDGKPDTAAS